MPSSLHHSPEPQRVLELGAKAAHRLHPRGKGSWLRIEAAFGRTGLICAQVEIRFRSGNHALVRPLVVERNVFRIDLRVSEGVDHVILYVQGTGNLSPARTDCAFSSTPRQLLTLARIAVERLRKPKAFVSSALWFVKRVAHGRSISLPTAHVDLTGLDAYDRWIELFDDRPDAERSLYEEQAGALKHRPVISVLAVATVREASELVEMMKGQVYSEWELVLVGTALTGAEDPRIKIIGALPTRPHALNAALSAATGDIVLALPEGARLRPHALWCAASVFADRPEIALLYTDEDTRSRLGRRHSPRFKPAWSPHAAASHDCVGDPFFLRTSALRSVGGWRADLAGAEDHDLKLRVSHAAGPDRIVHLAKVLLHREEMPAATTVETPTQMQVVNDHLARRGIAGAARRDPRSPAPRITHLIERPPLVSIIIPTRDRADLLDLSVGSLLARTRYASFEILIVNNGSREPKARALLHQLEKNPRVHIIQAPGPFNYSALNNAAVREARGSIVALVNNDIEVLADDWLDEMVGYALEPDVGCVGAKLYYPNGRIQHAGVVTGLLGGAGHVHKHAPARAAGYLDSLVTVRDVSAVTAACLVVRKEIYEAVGGLDEVHFKVAFNDVDLCLKVSASGYRNVWTPFAELVHHESVSRGADLHDRDKADRFALELSALEERWGARLHLDPFYSPHLCDRSEDALPRTA